MSKKAGSSKNVVRSAPDVTASYPIVGVGASAGGLEAFTQLLRQLPAESGMAFVLIQHLDPNHTSLLSEALRRATPMPVTQAEDGGRVEVDHVYVIPPDHDLAILHGRLTLLPRADGRAPHLPIDGFFRSLAADRGSQAIGVVLSGTASDGTEGLRAIKSEHGITFAQDPSSAKFGGMPHSAVDAGVVDHCLPIPELAAELLRLRHHPYLADRDPAPRHDEAVLDKVFVVMRSAVGVDFSEYKRPTFERRLARRMAVRHAEGIDAYLKLLREEPAEIQALYEDILIHVTSFFRDAEVFETLKARVLPDILQHKPAGTPVRVWVAGCATGEEVYSIAITLLETLGESARLIPIQIFGSDVSEKAIQLARAGLYGDGAMREVSEERRRRHFTKTERGHQIDKSVRDLCVFVRHDLGRDPPFSKIDLVSCRNVLIYFDQGLHRRVLPIFHYCLNQPGYLLLGRAETITGSHQLFRPIEKGSTIFERTEAPSALRFAARPERHPVPLTMGRGRGTDDAREVDLSKILDRALVTRYGPPGVLVDENMEILQLRGTTGPFLQPASGAPQQNLLKMARPGLLSGLRAAMARAQKEQTPARQRVEVEHEGQTTPCEVVVIPLRPRPEASAGEGSERRWYVVAFETVARAPAPAPAATRRRPGAPTVAKESQRVARLEHELAATREYLESLLEEHGQTNDDLGSLNEELISGNEELQSMNEELETAKEELQSTNEELTTVNDELHSRNHEVSQINSDLVNLVNIVDIAIVILDMDRRIRRFSPKARGILNILPSDVGRPLDDLRPNIEVPDLDQQISDVIETLVMKESEVADRDGHWYRMQIRPYKTPEHKITGAVLSLVDIDALMHNLSQAEHARVLAEQASRAKDEFLATLSHELRSPLASLLLNVELLQRGTLDAERLKRVAGAIQRAAQSQARLVDDLLDVSRVITGKLNLERHPVDLGAAVLVAIEGVSAAAAKKAIRVEAAIHAPDARVSGDAGRLQQVLANLLTNALKFTPEGGRVTVTLTAADGRARVAVADSGMGIEPRFLPNVFDPFTQADSSSTRVHGGLGLGLAIVRHLVEAHGGSVKAESAGLGKGAMFSLTLPLLFAADGEVTTAAASASTSGSPLGAGDSSPPQRPLQGLADTRIMLVEDDRGTREVLAEILVQAGATVQVAASAAEAWRIITGFRPQVLVCDIAMPGEDGYSLMRRIRTLPLGGGGDVPALALTALAGDEDRRRALAAGFSMHLAKPVKADRLIRAVAGLRPPLASNAN